MASAQTPLTQHPEEMILCRKAKRATGSAAKPLGLTGGERGEQEEMKNKSQSRGCAEELRAGVIFVSRVGSVGVTTGERIKHSHPDKRMCLCKGRGKGKLL